MLDLLIFEIIYTDYLGVIKEFWEGNILKELEKMQAPHQLANRLSASLAQLGFMGCCDSWMF